MKVMLYLEFFSVSEGSCHEAMCPKQMSKMVQNVGEGSDTAVIPKQHRMFGYWEISLFIEMQMFVCKV